MEDLRQILSKMPPWIFSALTVLAILWLTLAPHPLGENPPPLFPGADKLAHAIMFGGLTLILLLDWQRKHRWKSVGIILILTCSLISSVFGFLIEIAQLYMELGRGFEYADIASDIIGAFIFGVFYMYFQNFWTSTSNK